MHILRRFKPNNIMHVLHDDILPLYYTLRELVGEDFLDTRLVSMEGWNEQGDGGTLLRLLSNHPIIYKADLPAADLVCFRSVRLM